MIGKKLPQNLLSGIALGVCVGAIMLALFYGQYRWLAGEIVNTSAAEHEVVLRESFERRFRAQLHELADVIAADTENTEAAQIAETLNRMIADNEALLGGRQRHASTPADAILVDGSRQEGSAAGGRVARQSCGR